MLRYLISRLAEDVVLLVLLLALGPLVWLAAAPLSTLPALVDWRTIAALAGLMVLSRGLEDSGYLAYAGRRLLVRLRSERQLAIFLVLFAAALSAVVTNDVALFIVVPLTLALRAVADLPVGRLIVFEALAVNAGSSISPIGNPQNLFLWQVSGATFLEFAFAMLPLGLSLLAALAVTTALAFPSRAIAVGEQVVPRLDGRLLWISLALYAPFLLLVDLGFALPAAAAIVALFAITHRSVVRGVDWLLLAVFVLMFVDLGLLARLPLLHGLGQEVDTLPGGAFTAGLLVSQLMSNVPAAIFLAEFTTEWRLLAWGVSVGGFGLAVGSLANLIALRLGRQRGLWREFLLWSIPALLVATVLVSVLSYLGVLDQA